MNTTLAEYKKRTDIQQEGETVKIIKVADHKTGLFRSAKLVIPPDNLSKLHVYVTIVSPSQDPSGRCLFLLCLEAGKQLTNFIAHFRNLAKNYGLTPIMVTNDRKSASMEAARHLSSQGQHW